MWPRKAASRRSIGGAEGLASVQKGRTSRTSGRRYWEELVREPRSQEFISRGRKRVLSMLYFFEPSELPKLDAKEDPA